MSRNDQIIAEFRANNGVVGGFFEGSTLLLLHTTGAKTGTTRIAPLVCVVESGHFYVAASKGGADTHPDWFFNVRAEPAVTIEVGDETHRAHADILVGVERDEAYAKLAARYGFFHDYARKTDRVIPVIELTLPGS